MRYVPDFVTSSHDGTQAAVSLNPNVMFLFECCTVQSDRLLTLQLMYNAVSHLCMSGTPQTIVTFFYSVLV